MAHTLQEVIDLVTAEKTAIGSVKALIVGLESQLSEALSGVALPAAVQAQVDAIFAAEQENAAAIADALAAGVPPAPAPPGPTPDWTPTPAPVPPIVEPNP